jgi:hypothetical protein
LTAQSAIGTNEGQVPVQVAALAGRRIETEDESRLGADQVPQFVGDRAEHLGWLSTAGYEHGHPPQGGLLIHQLPQSRRPQPGCT